MKSFFCLSLALLAAPALSAEIFSPDATVHHAVTHHPELAAARLLITEARARREQAGRLSNPEVEADVRPNTNGREGVLSFGLTQRFPLAGRLRAERAVSDAEIGAAEAELSVAERQLAQRTALAACDWLATAARLELASRQLTNAQALAAALQAAADQGEVPRLDARQLTLEAGQIALRRRQVEQEQATLRGELHRLLNLPAAAALELSGTLPAAGNWPAPEVATTNDRPEVQIALARIETARREVQLARSQRWQDVGVGLVSELQRSDDQPAGMQRDDFVGLRVALPLPFWNRNQGRIRETATLVERRQKELDAVQARVRTEQEAARETLALATATEREWREQQLPLARELEEQMRRQREVGQASFTDWSRARERRLQAEAGHLEARRDLLRAWLQMQAAFGQFPRFPSQP
jgi:cobalt-zinc-cadmium efflux system outer membrane protein